MSRSRHSCHRVLGGIGLVGSAWILGSVAFSSPAKAVVIGVQFYSTGTSTGINAPSTALQLTQTAGVPSDPTNGNASYLQANWNAIGSPQPGTIASGSLSSATLLDSTGSANALGATFAYQSGDTGGSHKGGTYNDEIPSSVANPNSSGYYQSSLLGGTLADNSNSDSSLLQFSNLPTSGYKYTVVAYTENYGTTVMRLQVGGTALLAGNGTYAEGAPTLTGPGGFGTNPTTSSDQIYVVQQSGPASGSAVNTANADASFDGSTFVTSPIAYITNSTNNPLPTTASNYAVWTGVTPDSNGNILLSWNKYGGSITTDINVTTEGVSAVQLIATPVPEPIGMSLLGLGGLMALARRRKGAKTVESR